MLTCCDVEDVRCVESVLWVPRNKPTSASQVLSADNTVIAGILQTMVVITVVNHGIQDLFRALREWLPASWSSLTPASGAFKSSINVDEAPVGCVVTSLYIPYIYFIVT